MLTSLTQKRLKERIHYDPSTGDFRWVGSFRGKKKDKLPGRIDKTGHLVIGIDRKRYRAARLAWLYMTGEWPEHEVDHKDMNPSNDRWRNLRKATRSQNAANQTSVNATGFKGVYAHRKKFCATIKIRGKRKYLGTFDTACMAHNAYAKAAVDAFGEFARLK